MGQVLAILVFEEAKVSLIGSGVLFMERPDDPCRIVLGEPFNKARIALVKAIKVPGAPISQ